MRTTISTISKITLATLLCLSTNNYVLVSSADAATKSAISPDVYVSQPSTPTAQEPPTIPAIAAPPATINIESNTGGRTETLVTPEASSVGNQSSPVQVRIESEAAPARTAAKGTSKAAPKNLAQRIDRPEIVLENRSTGCKFKASSLLERDSDLCNPQKAIARSRSNNPSYVQNGKVIYAAASGDTSVQVRRLSDKEIAEMSLPSNGDKQMLFPLVAPSIISSIFGERVHPITGQVRFHQGSDIAAPEGTPVVAAFSGRVEIAGWLGGYGLMVVITHGDTHETRYAHLSEVFVKPGQEVKQGNVIGLVGSTGMATGPHLHFEIWRKMQEGLVAIDPTPQLILAMENLQKYLAQSPKPTNKA